MSTGHLRYEKKTDAELYKMLGEGDTARLYARSVETDTAHSIPYCGGVSVDGRTVYIDRQFYRDVMRGRIAVKGMSARQLIQAIIEHEHAEWSIDSGDNPVDNYAAAHEYATAKEERFVRMLGVNPERYEAAILPGLDDCLERTPVNPPKDLWCGPYLDDPTPADKEILRRFRACGVTDAHKVSKASVHYGIGADKCQDCAMFGTEKSDMRSCDLVSGLVRADRHCDRWVAKKAKSEGKAE